jgi:integral membrane sensor domain MASE1
MQTTKQTQNKKAVAWKRPAVFAATTAICTILAIWAVVQAPTEGSPVSGVSGLYIAAAIYVPVALWFGIWGCLAGYLSCVFMGLFVGYSLDFVLVWALADFFEGFVPLLVFRSLKSKPSLKLNRPKITYSINMLLMVNLIVSAWALINAVRTLFIGTFVFAIALLVMQALLENHKSWFTWLAVGVFGASLVSGIFGVGALVLFGSVPVEAFSTVFFGWVFGDIIVLATLGTMLTVVLTPYIVKAGIYVKRYVS